MFMATQAFATIIVITFQIDMAITIVPLMTKDTFN